MRAVVTGATGLVGSTICRTLLAAGHEVRAFHRTTSNLLAIEGLPVEHAVGDVMDQPSLETAFQGMDWVFHTAGRVAHWRDGGLLVNSIVQGTQNVLNAARAAGVKRFVFTSSAAALGVAKNNEIMDETHDFNYTPQRWPYGFAKHLAEQEVREAVAAGLDCVIVNPTAIFGPRDLNVIGGSLIMELVAGRVPAIPVGGMNSVHVDDVAEGHVAAAERGKPGERYILGGVNLTHAETIAVVADELKLRPPRFTCPPALIEPLAILADAVSPVLNLPANGDLLRLSRYYMYFDSSKAKAELGLGEPRPFRQAIREAIDWYRENGFLN